MFSQMSDNKDGERWRGVPLLTGQWSVVPGPFLGEGPGGTLGIWSQVLSLSWERGEGMVGRGPLILGPFSGGGVPQSVDRGTPATGHATDRK